MSDLSLPFMRMDQRKPIFHRFFFGLKFDDILARAIRAFAEEHLSEKDALDWLRLHMTLALTYDFEEVPAGFVDALLRAGDAVRAAPFELELTQLSGSNASLALRPEHVLPALKALQRAIVAAMKEEGVAMRPEWSFSPHVTLGYRKAPPFSRPVTGFASGVTEFVLVHSLVGMTRHETIGRWPLRPAEDNQFKLL